jgi:hypothetical protein
MPQSGLSHNPSVRLYYLPTVLAIDGFSVRIYLPPREHEPAHVHVVKDAGEVILLLGNASTPPAVPAVYGMQDHDALRAYRIVEAHQAMLRDMWRKYHE